MDKKERSQLVVNNLEQIRRQNQERLVQAKFYWNSLANQRLFETSKNLITVATVIIPLILVILGLAGLDELTRLDRTLLSIVLILLFSSLAFGVKHIRREAEFFHRWAETESKRSAVFAEAFLTDDVAKAYRRYNEMTEKSEKLRKKLKLDSGNTDLYIQMSLVAGAVVLIALVIFRVLLNGG